VLPSSSSWWLDHYQGFREHLERYRRTGDPETALIYELETRAAAEEKSRRSA
jgi:hypothetical protein